MSYEWLFEPLEGDAPCGPDLAETYDDAFADYYYAAEARMPERYVTPGLQGEDGTGLPDRVFDPKSIDHRAEKAIIDDLLKRSRDLRLLSLLARFQGLAGRLDGVAEAVGAMAGLLEKFPADVHPGFEHGTGDRRAALEDMAGNVTMVFPLQYLNLVPDGQVSLRRYMVASGQVEPRDGEEDVKTSDLISALAAPSAKEAVGRANALLSGIAGDLDRIVAACRGNAGHPFTPSFDRLRGVIGDLQDLIRMGRSDLEPYKAMAAEPEPEPAGSPGPAPVPATPAGEALAIGSQSAARAALEAAERYFVTAEPASAALLLVTQARLLVGRPLVEALETLLPAHAGRAVIDFGPETGFLLSMERLKTLSGSVPQAEAATPEPPAEPPAVASRADAASAMLGVEAYYRRHEPASPIPLLLQRARSYLDKDFQALVGELIPVQKSE